jgi:hypothetical protein
MPRGPQAPKQLSTDSARPTRGTGDDLVGGLVAMPGFSPKTTPLVKQLSALPAVGPFSPTDPSISGTN